MQPKADIPDALMEHLGHAAAEAETEEEAEAFIGALVPLAARLLPRAASAVMRVAPNLIRGAAGAARALRSNPATRPLVRTLPTVVRQTTAALWLNPVAGSTSTRLDASVAARPIAIRAPPSDISTSVHFRARAPSAT